MLTIPERYYNSVFYYPIEKTKTNKKNQKSKPNNYLHRPPLHVMSLGQIVCGPKIKSHKSRAHTFTRLPGLPVLIEHRTFVDRPPTERVWRKWKRPNRKRPTENESWKNGTKCWNGASSKKRVWVKSQMVRHFTSRANLYAIPFLFHSFKYWYGSIRDIDP